MPSFDALLQVTEVRVFFGLGLGLRSSPKANSYDVFGKLSLGIQGYAYVGLRADLLRQGPGPSSY